MIIIEIGVIIGGNEVSCTTILRSLFHIFFSVFLFSFAVNKMLIFGDEISPSYRQIHRIDFRLDWIDLTIIHS